MGYGLGGDSPYSGIDEADAAPIISHIEKDGLLFSVREDGDLRLCIPKSMTDEEFTPRTSTQTRGCLVVIWAHGIPWYAMKTYYRANGIAVTGLGKYTTCIFS
ncbi:hypothetical protein N7466_003352 [Penicillium verhagenii]|uniref:uncharacterized protein n=1 Tax=Penicillium verhagenii TaxID=1562060 RepID=UPI0025457CE7|nr:uncharacterized protein N7466_003352 [Penicillium verhagenii]KAJ5936902.1 hypothetical protein N7466_003352 [Penicillium verhagenii]